MDHGPVPLRLMDGGWWARALTSPTGRRLQWWGGMTLTLAACAFVAHAIVEIGLPEGVTFASGRTWAMVGLATPLYAASQLFLVLGWLRLVNIGARRLGLVEGFSIFARTQILKYLPTNVLHLAGRYGACIAAGVEQRVVLRSLFLEAALLVVTATALAVALSLPVLLGLYADRLPAILSTRPWLLAASAIALTGLAWWLVRVPAVPQARQWAAYALAMLSYALFFAASGGIVMLLLGGLGPAATEVGPGLVIGLVAMSWVFGFVTPAAPGGIGVREAALIAGLGSVGHTADAVAVAIAYRFSTIGGDLVLAAAGWLVGRTGSGVTIDMQSSRITAPSGSEPCCKDMTE